MASRVHVATITFLVASVAALGGCLDGNDEGQPTPQDPDVAPGPGNNTSSPTPSPSPTAGNDSQPAANPTANPIEWASLEEATVRPGVAIRTTTGSCTTNFVFTDTLNLTVLMGVAAHCFATGEATSVDGCDPAQEPLAPGAEAQIRGADHPATLVYNSWYTMQESGETNRATCLFNDFALVAVHPDDIDVVNPAMLHFGGPTHLVAPSNVQVGDRVFFYGATPLQPTEELRKHEGSVTGTYVQEQYTQVLTILPGVPGDSGSGVLRGDGHGALGILVTLSSNGTNGVTTLGPALAYAEDRAGIVVQLATWEALADGILPV